MRRLLPSLHDSTLMPLMSCFSMTLVLPQHDAEPSPAWRLFVGQSYTTNIMLSTSFSTWRRFWCSPNRGVLAWSPSWCGSLGGWVSHTVHSNVYVSFILVSCYPLGDSQGPVYLNFLPSFGTSWDFCQIPWWVPNECYLLTHLRYLILTDAELYQPFVWPVMELILNLVQECAL